MRISKNPRRTRRASAEKPPAPLEVSEPREVKADYRASRVAYLDCFSGISGDMVLGALVDAGVPLTTFEDAVRALNVGATLELSRVNRSGITASKVDVAVNGRRDSPREAQLHQHHTSTARPGHTHPHEHHSAQRRHTHEHGRGLNEIRDTILAAKISEPAKRTAIAIFERLGTAEAKIHNVPIEQIHFHEVGAADALVDIVCAAVGFEALDIDELVCSPLNVGGGTVDCAHGTFPVPAPATVELLQNAPVYSSGIQAELVTPTGAAIVATVVKRFAPFPAMEIETSGYGAGTRDLPGHANVLRITIGRATPGIDAQNAAGASPAHSDTVVVLEANLDDLNPQIFGYVMDRLFEEGALDVFGVPVHMKKDRPGVLLTALARPEDSDRLSQIIFSETTTLGVRRRQERRQVLSRRSETVQTRYGDIRIKIGSINGSVSNYAPEFEDCRRLAEEKKVPLKSVLAEAMQQYLKSIKG
jgi:pyridinium-3,5-bisthiocarboxylic acid mononucleotide nickel chelatase